MGKNILFIFFVLIVFVTIPSVGSAQRGWYDPWFREMRVQELMGAISGADCRFTQACEGEGMYDPRWDPRLNDPRFYNSCHDAQNYFEGIRGYFHFEKKKIKILTSEGKEKKVEVVWKHFRACDPTNHPVRTRETAFWTGLGGGGLGAVIADTKGAIIGTVAGGFVGKLFGDDHGDCVPVGLPIIPTLEATVLLPYMQNMQTIQPTIQSNKGKGPVAYQEQMPITQQSIGYVDPLAGITWQTTNTTDFRAVVIDPNLPEDHPKKKRLIPAWGSVSLPEPAGDQPYTVTLLEPGKGKSNPVSGEIRPTKDLQGWEIVAPPVREE